MILGVSEGAGKYMRLQDDRRHGKRHARGVLKSRFRWPSTSTTAATTPRWRPLRRASPPLCSTVPITPSTRTLRNQGKSSASPVKKGISVEAEVGAIGGEEDGVVGSGEVADPAECKMIAELGVTMLAAGIGNIHGKYPANWKGLDFDVLAKIQEPPRHAPRTARRHRHSADMIKKAISLGVSENQCQHRMPALLCRGHPQVH